MRKIGCFIFLIVLALTVAACGGGSENAVGSADVSVGEELFASPVIGMQAGCVTCHSLTPDTRIVGPSMAGIASRAGSTVAGQSAEAYIRESILNPDAYVVDDFPTGTMPQVWGEELSNEQLDQIVAYLLTLE